MAPSFLLPRGTTTTTTTTTEISPNDSPAIIMIATIVPICTIILSVITFVLIRRNRRRRRQQHQISQGDREQQQPHQAIDDPGMAPMVDNQTNLDQWVRGVGQPVRSTSSKKDREAYRDIKRGEQEEVRDVDEDGPPPAYGAIQQ